jgi:hypothetical protein
LSSHGRHADRVRLLSEGEEENGDSPVGAAFFAVGRFQLFLGAVDTAAAPDMDFGWKALVAASKFIHRA